MANLFGINGFSGSTFEIKVEPKVELITANPYSL